jgi:membrane protein DedA with SNARE-associated domain
MLTFLIFSAFAGVLLGLRFKVLVLIPATFLMVAAIAIAGIGNGQRVLTILLTIFGAAALLQLGYFAGCIIHAPLPGRRSARTTMRFTRAGYGAERDVEYFNT